AGTSRGYVRLTGTPPRLAPLPVNNNRAYCGGTRPNTWLRVDSSGGLADAVVYLADLPADIRYSGSPSTTSETVDIDHVQCEITPRIRIVQAGTTAVLRNSDSIFHSTRLRVAGTKLLPFGSGLLPGGSPSAAPTVRLFEPRFYELECSVD